MATTTLDIERLFGLVSRQNEHPFASGVPPGDDDPPMKEIDMAMVRVTPVTVQVRTDWFEGIPREITWGEERFPVTRLLAVRDESSAFPAITGPRTMFEVETPVARLGLTYHHRSRRWAIEGLDQEQPAA
jgi:hypothetical protein